MHIRLSTQVNGHYQKVMAHFERPLFEALKPKGVDFDIVEFTGSRKGDRVHIRFKRMKKGDWISLITEDGMNDKEAWFVDEGTTMPLHFTHWVHRHIVQKHTETTSIIVDDLTYRNSNIFLGLLMYPVVWLGLFQRKKIYRRYFRDF